MPLVKQSQWYAHVAPSDAMKEVKGQRAADVTGHERGLRMKTMGRDPSLVDKAVGGPHVVQFEAQPSGET